MDKTQLQTVLARVNAAPTGAAVSLTVEEAGLLQAFVAVRQRAGEVSAKEQALLSRIVDALKVWKAPGELDEVTQRRQQVLLRNAIDKAQLNNWSVMTADDLGLLQSTHQVLSKQEPKSKANERLLSLLGELLKRHEEYKSRESAAESTHESAQPWLPIIAISPPQPDVPVNSLIAADFFQRVTPAAVEHVGGCPVQLTARTFEVTGPTHLVGDLPSDVILRVKDGSLTLDGFVSGHIVADGDIIVRGNVQGGWVVATRGHIALERALLGSRVVAESGAVFCTGTEGAACVFGWRGVVVRETALSSVLAGGRVWVGETLTGTSVEACGPVVAHGLDGAMGPTVVCLLPELSSEVYGRRPSDDVKTMRRAIGQYERRIQQGERQMRYVQRLSQSCHRTAIFFLVGGVQAATLAPEFQDLQSLALQLDELLHHAEGAAQFFEPLLSGSREVNAEDVELFANEMAKSLAYLTRSPDAGPEQPSRLHGMVIEHAQSFGRSLRFLQRHVDSPKGATYFRDVFQRDVREWKEQAEKTRQKLEHLVATFEVHPELLNRVRQEGALEQVFAEVLQKANSDANSDEAIRARSPLIRVLLTTVERNRKSLQSVQAEVNEARAELARMRTQLAEESAVLFADQAPGSIYVEAEEYETGTVITTSPDLRQGIDGTLRPVIALQQPIHSATRFVLEKSVLRRVDSRAHSSAK